MSQVEQQEQQQEQQEQKYKLYAIYHESDINELLYIGRTSLSLKDRLSRHISKARTCLKEMQADIDNVRNYSEMAMHIIEYDFTGFIIKLVKNFDNTATIDEMIRVENDAIIEMSPLLNIVNTKQLCPRTICPCGGIVIKGGGGHYNTAQHQTYLYVLEHGVKPATRSDIPNRHTCTVCGCSVALAGKRDHEKTKKHVNNVANQSK